MGNYLIIKRKNFSFGSFSIAHEITFLFLGVLFHYKTLVNE